MVVNCRNADIIVGPIGIVIADALLGEITPAMATAVCQSSATRVLIPVNHCENYIVGVPDQPIGSLVAAAVQKVKASAPGKAAEIFYKQTGGCTKCCTAACLVYSAHITGAVLHQIGSLQVCDVQFDRQRVLVVSF